MSASKSVKYMTGRDPEDFETIVKQYVARPENKRSFVGFFYAFLDFLKILVTPAYDLQKWARISEIPTPESLGEVEYAQESKDWRESRLEVPVKL
ncbi:hypothetical protein HDU97_002643 [Phlyctochytrium planicorne]|nr:hypothetical protein HDU97_002643 [Phlyctochytrium planicorne]